jgi:hypothetical protein
MPRSWRSRRLRSARPRPKRSRSASPPPAIPTRWTRTARTSAPSRWCCSQIYEPLIHRASRSGRCPGPGASWRQVEPTRWRFVLRRACVPRGRGLQRRRRGVLHHPRAAADLELRHLRRHRGPRGEGGRLHGGHRHQGPRPDPAEQVRLGLHDVEGPGRSGTTRRARRTPASARRCTPSATPTAPAPSAFPCASPTCAPCWCATTTGGAGGALRRRQRDRDRLPPDRVRRDAHRGAALGRGRLRARPAAAGPEPAAQRGQRVLEGPEVRTIFSRWTCTATSCSTATCAAATR